MRKTSFERLARSSFDHLLPAQGSVKAGPRVTILSRNLATGSAFAMGWMCGGLDHQTHGGEHGQSWQQGPLSISIALSSISTRTRRWFRTAQIP